MTSYLMHQMDPNANSYNSCADRSNGLVKSAILPNCNSAVLH
uniref:Uncharacterized protein n=1 Tax=Arundo donax TaxID=35708 RepID=A0A0A9AGS7_ARUDO